MNDDDEEKNRGFRVSSKAADGNEAEVMVDAFLSSSTYSFCRPYQFS